MDRKKLLCCWHCEKVVKHNIEEYFFWCNKKCHDAHEESMRQRRIEQDRNHYPAERRGEVDRTNDLIKASIQRHLNGYTEEGNNTGEPVKGKRRCGKCGEVGHNARTCSK